MAPQTGGRPRPVRLWGLLGSAGLAAATGSGPGAANRPNCTFQSCPQCLPKVQNVSRLSIIGPDGKSYQAPLRIGRALELWDTQSIYAHIVGVLVQEKLGIEVQYEPCLDEVMCYMGVNNCLDWQHYDCGQLGDLEAGAPMPDGKVFKQDPLSDIMFAPVVSYGSTQAQHFVGTDLDYDRRPGVSLGPSGYTSVMGVYVWSDVVDRALKGDGIDLLWLREFKNPATLKYVNTPKRVRDDGIGPKVMGCSSNVSSIKAAMEEHSELGWVCNSASWWLTPECARLNGSWATQCVVMFDDDWASPKPDLYKAVAQSGVAIAKVMLGYEAWRSLLGAKKYNVTFAWWGPDATLKDPARKIGLLPELEPQPAVVLKAAWSPALQASAPLKQFLSSVYIQTVIMNGIMDRIVQAELDGHYPGLETGNNFYQKLACDWLRDNDETWNRWFPSASSCSAGQVFSESEGQCLACPVGTHFERLRNGTGFILQCTPCGKGYYASEEGLLECSPCPQGSYLDEEGGESCKKCEPGRSASSLGQSRCDACAAGSATLSVGVSECATCVLGTFSLVGATACTVCPPGTYASQAGATNCTVCEFPLMTVGRGSVSIADCVCPEGTYRALGDAGCKACPNKMDCELGSSEASLWSVAAGQGPALDAVGRPMPYPKVEEAYWTPSSNPLSVFRCISKAQCPGGDPNTCTDHLIDQACAHCEPSYNWDGSKCVLCSGGERSSFMFPTLPILIVFAAVIGMYCMFRDPYEKWNSWQNSVNALAFLTLNHYQILTLIRNTNVKLPPLAQEIFSFWSFSEDVIAVFKLSCSGHSDFKQSMIFKSVSPLGLLAITCITYWGSKVLAMGLKRPILSMDLDRTWNVFFSLIFTFFNSIASLSLSLFKCTTNPNRKLTLTTDPAMDCYEGEWNSLIIVAAFAVAVYCVGCGLLFAWAIYSATRHQNFVRRGFQMRWKFLFIKFRADVHWWALVLLLRGVLINSAFVFVTRGLGQLYWVMMEETLYLAMTIFWMPWRQRVTNVLSCATAISIMYACALMAIYTERDTDLDSKVAMIAVCISFVPLGIFVLLGVRLLLNAAGLTKQETLDYKHLMEAARGILEMDRDTLISLFHSSGDWDKFFILKFCEVVRSEYLGIDTGMRTLSRVDVISTSMASLPSPRSSGGGATGSANMQQVGMKEDKRMNFNIKTLQV